LIAGSAADDARPIWIPDGILHGATLGDRWTLCGRSTEGLHRFADQDFETVTISSGGCEVCIAERDELN
jgi:hypothetical protein